MKKLTFFLLVSVLLFNFGLAQPAKSLRVFISVDMEGISGVVSWQDVEPSAGGDYEYFRKIMSLEANAAVEGALAAGATEVWVRDAHDTARNILPDLLDKRAKLIRDWSGAPQVMMDGIDKTFAAVVFVGYHAKAGTPDATLEHTMSSSRITDVKINGISLPEAGINALIAGYYDVPVVFAAGDKALCDQAKKLFGEVETVAVKEGLGGAAICLQPEVSREKIKAGVTTALQNLGKYKPYKLTPPYKLVLVFKDEKLAYNGQFYPGAKRTGDWELTYESNDLMDVIQAFEGMLKN
jgi:D-amino peptidase